ncbi:DEAD/DEAH box helicase [Neobacillus ginsengisoli]|uniref:Superfamily II DNA or RNA helicase n=1 Tax=Neobacillus ginsengisoli TaxID=904295 RepID=A0ABT9XX71_9BACI|nr:DEAD/DEAH box helicase [Neobacillus ginsengisoli]MDQ0200170.1 superfamily II DNA or RNA helicase [Neobacillus ginsengisoli]
MNLVLTKKMIKQLCGDHSFKRGEDLFRRQKVSFNHFFPERDVCKAIVKGNVDFQISIENNHGNLHAECTCPKLASFDKNCHHIAAVLIGLLELQKMKMNEDPSLEKAAAISAEDIRLTNGMLGLFGNKGTRPTSHQYLIENRELIDVEFTINPIPVENEGYMFGIKARAGSKQLHNVNNLTDFLRHIERRDSYKVSKQFTFDPELHHFQKKTDEVIHQLIQVQHDEKLGLLTSSQKDRKSGEQMILVPPSAWESIFPLLSVAPFVRLEQNEKLYDGIQLSAEPIPLNFVFDEANTGGYQLSVKGLNDITIMESYGYVLFEGQIRKIPMEDMKRLSDLKRMLDSSGKHQFQIPTDQLETFVEKVIPGLRKLGQVRIEKNITDRLIKTPLKAKLYLDRVKNRLLAGLEFHYGNVVINPLEGDRNKLGAGTSFIRNGEQEQQILQLMEESSFTKTEEGYFLHNEELEYHFLYHVVPKFRKLAQIFATTAVRLRLFKGNAHPKIRVEIDGRTDWLVFTFDLQGIPESEIRNLLQSLEEKRKYYRLPNGSLLSLESHEFKEMNRFLNGIGVNKEEINNEIRLPLVRGMQLIDSLENENMISLGQSFKHFLNDLRNPDKLKFAIPNSLDTILRDYQKLGYQWLKTLAHYGFGGILADDMGLGKTLQSIAFIQSVLPDIRKEKMPALIVSPSSLIYNWMNELKKFAPTIRAVIIDGSKEARINFLKNLGEVDIVITSYPLLRKDSKQYSEQMFHTLIFDEAQAFKNPATQTAKAAKMLRANYRFALTGTPVENSIDELWSIFNVVFPNLLPGRKAFHDLTRETVAKRVRPFILRRLKEDVLEELPEKIDSMYASELLPEQKKLYAAYLAKLKHDAFKHLDKDTFQKNRIKILAGLTRLRQLCCHPALFVDGYPGKSGKFEQLLKILAECRSAGKRILIFSQFTKMLEIIGRELGSQGVPFFYLDGNTPASKRVEICDRFNEGESDMFLISLKAGGTGLNLTGADTVILYDLWWNPAVEEQAADRAYRMGQKNVVQVIKLVAKGTIEEKMNELQKKKKNLIGEIIQPGKEKLSSLTEEDIKEILMI